MRGLALSVRGAQINEGELRLDFSADVGPRGDVIKAIFMEALDDFGASLSDFEKAKVTVDGASVRLSTKLSDDGLIRIMSLFMPATPPEPKVVTSPSTLQPGGANLDATRRYFQSVRMILEQLQSKGNRSNDYLQTAVWHESAAKRIEQLPVRYVDAEVVKFGDSTAVKLRTIAYSLRGVVVEVSALESGVVIIGHAIPTWYWWQVPNVRFDTNLVQVRSKQAEIVRKDASRRVEIWESIDKDRRAVVQSIRMRYGGYDLEKKP